MGWGGGGGHRLKRATIVSGVSRASLKDSGGWTLGWGRDDPEDNWLADPTIGPAGIRSCGFTVIEEYKDNVECTST